MLQTYEPHDVRKLRKINSMVYKIRETISGVTIMDWWTTEMAGGW